MEPSGVSYLYELATVSVTFVSLSVILWMFRQNIGGGMTRYDSYFVLSFMQSGFIVVGGSLLPSLLALYGLAPETVWRLSSAISAIPIFLFVAFLPGRRRAAAKEPMPPSIWIFLILQFFCAVYLVANAAGIPLSPGTAPYAFAMSG